MDPFQNFQYVRNDFLILFGQKIESNIHFLYTLTKRREPYILLPKSNLTLHEDPEEISGRDC